MDTEHATVVGNVLPRQAQHRRHLRREKVLHEQAARAASVQPLDARLRQIRPDNGLANGHPDRVVGRHHGGRRCLRVRDLVVGALAECNRLHILVDTAANWGAAAAAWAPSVLTVDVFLFQRGTRSRSMGTLGLNPGGCGHWHESPSRHSLWAKYEPVSALDPGGPLL